MFSFLYPQRHPDLEDVEFDVVAAVAEAAEKYEVFPALNTCRRRMRFVQFIVLILNVVFTEIVPPRDFVPTNPIQVCLYGARHGYLDIVKDTGPYDIALDLKTVVPLLPAQLIVPWVRHCPQLSYVWRWLQLTHTD